MVALVVALITRAQYEYRISSPDNQLQFVFTLNNDGALSYTVTYQNKLVVYPSALGVTGWEKGFSFSEVSFNEKDRYWQPVYGERSNVRDRYKEMLVTLIQYNNSKNLLRLQVRAYNEGIAFRYVFPEHPDGGKYISIKKELTEFTMPEGAAAWHTPTAQGIYNKLPLRNWPSEAERPLTLELSNGLFVCLAEAEMVNYSRTKFALHPVKPNCITTSIYSTVDYYTPFHSPWRVIMVAERPGDLLANNDIILNVNPPNEVKDFSWIRPGKIMREIKLSMQGAKSLVDFAVQRQLQYIHFDAGWYGYEYVTNSDARFVNVDPRRNPNSDLNLQEVIQYASKKGIGVFLYVNQRALFRQLDSLLPLYQQWGVKGIKFGFVQVGSQFWTNWLHEAVKKCAAHQLMVNIHDEYRPTGFSRTYPNLLTQEGIRGNEEMPDAGNSTIQPFTRLVAGAADHTICYYHRSSLKKSLAATQNAREMKTTSAHQLALAVVMYSPLQYMYWYDTPEDSQQEPELEFFDHVPTVFDDTKVINGNIGAFITIARRKGDEWFVGSVTNTEARELTIPLNFLEKGKRYEATIYEDDPTSKVRTKVSVKRIRVNAATVLKASLQPSGGQAIWIKPV